MDLFFEYIAPIIVGGFIGWFTNYLAIKMLFRPYKKIKILGISIPFTPGLIPKEKTRLAQSLSNTIAKEFLNRQILINYLTCKEMKQKISDSLDDFFIELKNNSSSFYHIVLEHIDKERFEEYITKINKKITKELIKKFIEKNMSQKIAFRVIKNITSDNETVLGKTIAFLINDKISMTMENIIKDKIDEYIVEKGESEVEKILNEEIRALLNNSVSNIYKNYENKIEKIKEHLMNSYEVLINNSIEKILGVIDFKKIIENRIQELDVKELESIILSIAKKELNAITYIGGVLGILIGMINIFI